MLKVNSEGSAPPPAGRPEGAAAGPGPVSEEKRREFKNLCQGERDQAPDRQPAEESLSAIFSGLMGGRNDSAGPAAAASAATPAPALDPDDLVNGLVRDILVSAPNQKTGELEVRLRVDERLLPDTEIRLTRGADGLLSVTLTAGRPEAFQTLVAAQETLRAALNSRESQAVRLAVVVSTDQSRGEDGSSERRSRGYPSAWPDEG
ncbi:MAG: flagellar hook-length control protein FliK [Candidatus Adiutrix sp.]|jgi:type III secretion system needle length determinant|nr:flagellar hook-length control protein FliK [Candidatus Adiutrix sp.]